MLISNIFRFLCHICVYQTLLLLFQSQNRYRISAMQTVEFGQIAKSASAIFEISLRIEQMGVLAGSSGQPIHETGAFLRKLPPRRPTARIGILLLRSRNTFFFQMQIVPIRQLGSPPLLLHLQNVPQKQRVDRNQQAKPRKERNGQKGIRILRNVFVPNHLDPPHPPHERQRWNGDEHENGRKGH